MPWHEPGGEQFARSVRRRCGVLDKQDWIESEKKESDPLEESEHVPSVPEGESEY